MKKVSSSAVNKETQNKSCNLVILKNILLEGFYVFWQKRNYTRVSVNPKQGEEIKIMVWLDGHEEDLCQISSVKHE